MRIVNFGFHYIVVSQHNIVIVEIGWANPTTLFYTVIDENLQKRRQKCEYVEAMRLTYVCFLL